MKDDNFTLLTAEIAHEATNNYVNLKDGEQLKRIDDQIRVTIKKGEYSFCLKEPLASNNRKILKKYGYKIYDNPSEEGDWLYCGVTISWH